MAEEEIEAALLKRLSEQGPVAVLPGGEVVGMESMGFLDHAHDGSGKCPIGREPTWGPGTLLMPNRITECMPEVYRLADEEDGDECDGAYHKNGVTAASFPNRCPYCLADEEDGDE